MTSKDFTILLVEDDPGHTILIQRNLTNAGIGNNIVAVDDGQRALDYLLREGEYDGVERDGPLLVLLDLNLPVMDGFQVLERVKKNEALRHIPIIVLTTTESPHEIKRAYALGCNVYLTKPVEYDDFISAIQKLGLLITVVSVPDEVLDD